MPTAILQLLARLLYAQLFLVSVWNKAFVDPFAGFVKRLADKGFPLPEVFAYGNVVFEFAVVLFLAIGFKTRITALAAMAFCLVAGLLFHDFWNIAPPAKYGQTVQLLKNFAMMGGLIYLAIYGPGPLSVDGKDVKEA
jgi:putative oxidoreductase